MVYWSLFWGTPFAYLDPMGYTTQVLLMQLRKSQTRAQLRADCKTAVAGDACPWAEVSMLSLLFANSLMSVFQRHGNQGALTGLILSYSPCRFQGKSRLKSVLVS